MNLDDKKVNITNFYVSFFNCKFYFYKNPRNIKDLKHVTQKFDKRNFKEWKQVFKNK